MDVAIARIAWNAKAGTSSPSHPDDDELINE
jgi:hypothetical protein